MLEDNISTYLEHVGWGTKSFSNQEMKAMLVAGILRFLGGRTTINFVFNLSDAISHQTTTSLDNILQMTTGVISCLEEQMRNEFCDDISINKQCKLILHMLSDNF